MPEEKENVNDLEGWFVGLWLFLSKVLSSLKPRRVYRGLDVNVAFAFSGHIFCALTWHQSDLILSKQI